VTSTHDELLEQEPRQAPEPETAEQRSKRVGWGAAGGGIVAGGAVAAKLGVLSKVALWLFAFHAVNVWRVGGWLAIAAIAVAVATIFALRSRREGP
jgi:hypothetical protein